MWELGFLDYNNDSDMAEKQWLNTKTQSTWNQLTISHQTSMSYCPTPDNYQQILDKYNL